MCACTQRNRFKDVALRGPSADVLPNTSTRQRPVRSRSGAPGSAWAPPCAGSSYAAGYAVSAPNSGSSVGGSSVQSSYTAKTSPGKPTPSCSNSLTSAAAHSRRPAGTTRPGSAPRTGLSSGAAASSAGSDRSVKHAVEAQATEEKEQPVKCAPHVPP